MTTIQIELPEATAQAARAAGLLTPQALDRLLNDALKRQEADSPPSPEPAHRERDDDEVLGQAIAITQQR